MNLKFTHSNILSTDLQRSIKFYSDALDLTEFRRKDFGKFIMVYLRDKNNFELEVRLNKNSEAKLNLGDNPTHIAFVAEDYDSMLKKHRQMNCVNFVDENLGVYFIKDPDGYNIEILSKNFFENL